MVVTIGDQGYKYLGIVELDKIKEEEMKCIMHISKKAFSEGKTCNAIKAYWKK